jgi:ABC-type multidrug transport system fused ATPase/permease subunit
LRGATEEQIVRGAASTATFSRPCAACSRQAVRARGPARDDLAEPRRRPVQRRHPHPAPGAALPGLNGLLFGAENVVTVWLGARLVLGRPGSGAAFSVGMLFAFVAYKTQFVQRVTALIEKGLEMRMLALHTERVADIALTPAEPRDDASALAARRCAARSSSRA